MHLSTPAFCRSPKFLKAIAIFAVAFGALTVFSGGQVLFGPDESRAAVGDYVPFVVWFNFLSGFAYMAAATGVLLRKKWGAYLALALAGSIAVVFAAFAVHVVMGGAFEPRTVGAMTLRLGVWMVISLAAFAQLARGQ